MDKPELLGDYRRLIPYGIASAAIDITDFMQYLPPSSANKWRLDIIDQKATNTELIDTFKIKYKRSETDAQQEYVANNLPVNIISPGVSTYAYITGETSPNHPPTQPTVTINPEKPTYRDEMVATASGSTDADGDSVTYRYQWWYVEYGSDWVFSNEGRTRWGFRKGTLFKCVVTPFDGKVDGPSTVVQMKIYNTPPDIRDGWGGHISVYENQAVNFSIYVTDPDECDWNRITLSTIGLPLGAKVVKSKQSGWGTSVFDFSWTPNYNQAGIYGITFKASDGESSVSKSVCITVNNVNRPPVFGPLYNKTVKAGLTLTFTVSGTDPDKDVLTYSASGLPSGATFDAQKRSFTWKPSSSQVGSYTVTFAATDPRGLSATKAINITVTK
jgi:hypothetical protein